VAPTCFFGALAGAKNAGGALCSTPAKVRGPPLVWGALPFLGPPCVEDLGAPPLLPPVGAVSPPHPFGGGKKHFHKNRAFFLTPPNPSPICPSPRGGQKPPRGSQHTQKFGVPPPPLVKKLLCGAQKNPHWGETCVCSKSPPPLCLVPPPGGEWNSAQSFHPTKSSQNEVPFGHQNGPSFP